MHDHRVDPVHLELQVYHVVLILNDPFGIILKVLGFGSASKGDGREQAGLAFLPQNIFVILILIDRLVASKVESKELFLPIHFAFSHCGDPIVVSTTGIVPSVIIHHRHGFIIRKHLLTIDHEPALCLKEILLAVKRTGALFIKGNADHAGIG